MAKRPKPSRSPNPATGRAVPDGTEVVRSEERVRVDTAVRVSGRAVLRKYLVTETVTQTFQVRHEEVRLEHEPTTGPESLSGDGSAVERAPFDDGVAVEMVLHREVPTVAMEVVAVERVRLHIDTVTSQVQVADDVRKEQVVLDSAEQPDRR